MVVTLLKAYIFGCQRAGRMIPEGGKLRLDRIYVLDLAKENNTNDEYLDKCILVSQEDFELALGAMEHLNIQQNKYSRAMAIQRPLPNNRH